MSALRGRVRASSIVGLYRGVTIESLSIEEVTADLERLGIDPAPSIELAKRLAERDADDPATALLQKLEAAEDVDAEIAALEQAPIEEIRSNLPEGAVENAAARAKERSADEDGNGAEADGIDETNVLPVKRRRRVAVFGWGGSLVGIAATVLVFIAVRSEFLAQMEGLDAPRSPIESPSSADETGRTAAAVEPADDAALADASNEKAVEGDASPPPVLQSRPRQQPVDGVPVTNRSSIALEQAAAEAEGASTPVDDDVGRRSVAGPEGRTGLLTAERVTPSAVPTISERPVRQALDATAGDDRPSPIASLTADTPESAPVAEAPSHLPQAKPVPTARELAALTTAGSGNGQPAAGTPSTTDVPGLPALPGELTGVFVVDADNVPTALQTLASAKSDDLLAAKVGEASLRALGRKVLALLAFDRDGQRVEAVLVETVAAEPLPDTAPTTAAGVTALAESQPQASIVPRRSLELIELPTDR